jgi:hypothetical protein
MLAAIIAKHNLKLKQYDITNAFIYATVNREIYIKIPYRYYKLRTTLRI